MSAWRRLLLAALLLSAALAGAQSVAPEAPPRADTAEAAAAAGDPARQLLVMLNLPRPHFRPDASYAGAYAAGRGDGVGLQARKAVALDLARRHGLELQSEWPMPLVGVDCFVLRLAAGDARQPEQVARALGEDPRVAWSQAMQVFQGQSARDEPLYPAQPAAQQWRLADLHELATGRGVRIAVVDSGIAEQHPDLTGQLQLNENFVEGRPLVGESHGTAVAAIIAARADNGLGIAGIAPQARLMGMRACWQAAADTLCTTLSLAKALHAAVLQGAQIINLSVAGPDDRLLGLLIDQALARGIAVVAALTAAPGNFPARHPGVLAVGNAAPLPSGAVLAPGRDVPSATPSGGWTLVNGSSFATAHVAGLLALLRELDARARPLPAALVIEPAGRIDACASLLRRPRSDGRAGACRLGQTAE